MLSLKEFYTLQEYRSINKSVSEIGNAEWKCIGLFICIADGFTGKDLLLLYLLG
jgi:hypothetical protein